jgi:hypothetical protein
VVKIPLPKADAFIKMRRRSTKDRIMRAFAQAVEEHDFAQAEGWLAVARLREDRDREAREGSQRRMSVPVGRKA